MILVASTSTTSSAGFYSGEYSSNVLLHMHVLKYVCLYVCVYSWLDSLFLTGCQKDLTQSDLYACPSEADSEKLLNRFLM